MGRGNRTIATVRPKIVPAVCPMPLANMITPKMYASGRIQRAPRNMSGERTSRIKVAAINPNSHSRYTNVGMGKNEMRRRSSSTVGLYTERNPVEASSNVWIARVAHSATQANPSLRLASTHAYRIQLCRNRLRLLTLVTTALHSVERFPEFPGGSFGRRKSILRRGGISLHALAQLLQPDLGVADVGRVMDPEVSTGGLIRAVQLFQPSRLRLGDARYLRLVRIKRRQRRFGSAVLRHMVKERGQLVHVGGRGLSPDLLTIGAHAIGEVEPQLGMRAPGAPVLTAFFIIQIGKHGAAQFRINGARKKLGKIVGKGRDMMVVVAGVFAKVLARQLTRAPRLVKRMTQQIVLGNTPLQFLGKLGTGH